MYTPVATKPQIATYFRKYEKVIAETIYTHEQSFLGLKIWIPHLPTFKLYNIYSPEQLNIFAKLTESFPTRFTTILIGGLNAHYI
jgi:hypothetical protein